MKHSALVAMLGVAAAACASGGSPNLAARAAPLPEPVVCRDDADLAERLVIDWSPLDRSKLESAARKGLVLVRVDGCSARIVEVCASSRRYAYSPTSRQREVMLVRDRDELRARLPLGAARFDAGLERASALSVAMTVVGRYEAPPAPIASTDLEGDCAGVTHAVASVAVGAFEVARSSAAHLSADADVALAGTHAGSDAERRHLDSAGDEARCAEARRTDTEPPGDCAIPLRVELRRIGAGALARAPSAPYGDFRDEPLRRATAMTRTEIAPCYRRAIANDPRLHGNMTLIASVAGDGSVLSVSARHDVPDALADCAIARMSRVTFPTGEGARQRVFVVPLVFNAARPVD
jgi:hypothetical protein